VTADTVKQNMEGNEADSKVQLFVLKK